MPRHFPRGMKIFGGKKGVSFIVFLKPHFSLSRQKLIKIKRNQLDPIGSARALPFGGKNLLIDFNFMIEITLKINNTKKSNSNNPIKFYIKNRFKNKTT